MSPAEPDSPGSSNATGESSSTKWWWLDLFPARWSVEERRTRTLLCLTTLSIYIALFLPEVWIFGMLRIEDHIGALLTIFTALIPAVFLSRPIGVRLCPELVSQADANAARRLASRKQS